MTKSVIFLCAVVVCVLLIETLVPVGESEAKLSQIFLARPAFAQQATTFPADEAGICAYVKVGHSVDPDKAKRAFEDIIEEGENYVIGVLGLSGLTREAFPYMYITSDGWIVAYYYIGTPASMIMHWGRYAGGPITTTTLGDAIAQISPVLGVDYENVSKNMGYWHFGYPEATKVLLAVDGGVYPEEKEHTCTYSIPYGLTVYNGSFGLFNGEAEQFLRAYVDGEEITTSGTEFKYGPLPKQYLAPEEHTVRLWVGGLGYPYTTPRQIIVIVFVYR